MNEQQEKEMIESLKRIAFSLENIRDRLVGLSVTIWIIALAVFLLVAVVF